MNYLRKTEVFYVYETRQTISNPLLFIHFPSKQKILKSRYTETTVNSFSFLEKKNNPQECIFLHKKKENYYIARVNTQKHYYQSTILSASALAAPISEEQASSHIQQGYPVWVTQSENFLTREILAEKTYRLPWSHSTDISALQFNLILVASSGPRQRTWSELQIKADFCFVTVTRQRNALCPYCFVISLKHLTARIGQILLKRLLWFR